jgi:hypothetical protein
VIADSRGGCVQSVEPKDPKAILDAVSAWGDAFRIVFDKDDALGKLVDAVGIR